MGAQAVETIGYMSVILAVVAALGLVGCKEGGARPSTGTDYYSIGGSVTGYKGSGLVLQNNSGDDLFIETDGSFAFSTPIADGQSYEVTVLEQPGSPDGYCNVIDGGGRVSAGDITGIAVKCVTGFYNVVDTGQDKCYSSATGSEVVCRGIGYDADYDGRQPNYTVSADGDLVYDNVTGLVWTQATDIDGNGSVDANDKRTQPEAARYCAGLSYGGYSWRLPSIKELVSLMDFRGVDPSGYSGSDTSALTPFIDDTVLEPGFGDTGAGERVIDGQYASSTLYTSPKGTLFGAGTMFGVNFVDGRIKGYPYDFPTDNPHAFYVRCVTGNPAYGANDLVDNGDGTVSDKATGLMWEQGDYRSSGFEDAISYCEAAATGGWSDWRLPNVKELQSIVDYGRSPDSTDSAALDPLLGATSFTNEAGEKDWGFYWASTSHVNDMGLGDNGIYVAFGRALGYFNGEVVDVHGAGAQRSNGKSDITRQADGTANVGYGAFYYHGPQGDLLRLDNMVRCVRDSDAP